MATLEKFVKIEEYLKEKIKYLLFKKGRLNDEEREEVLRLANIWDLKEDIERYWEAEHQAFHWSVEAEEETWSGTKEHKEALEKWEFWEKEIKKIKEKIEKVLRGE